jgi:RNA polymerase sigma-70 factor (ECF subfamily)
MAENIYTTKNSLYARFLKGEESAACEIISTYRAGLILFINGYVKNPIVAEDLASEVFVKILVKKPKLKNENYFKTYIYKAGRNLALTHLKKQKKLVELSDNLPYNDDPETLLIKNDTNSRILNAVVTLKSEYRQVLTLRYFDNLDIIDIAKITGCSKKKVYNQLQRAKTALKTILEKEGLDIETD